MLPELAHLLGAIPLSWLVDLRAGGLRRGVAWWLMASAFAVSFVADSLAHIVNGIFISQLYLVSQGALSAYAISPRDADRFVPVMLVAAGVSLALRQGEGLDWLLHLTAWGGVAWLALRSVPRGTLLAALLVYFGGGGLAWLWFAASPGWGSWLAYQSTRVVGIALWCVAATLHHSPGRTLAAR